MDDDAALLAAVCDGSERAFNALIDRHQQAVRTFLRGLTSREDADDVAQETFLAAWTQAQAFRGQSSVRSWLFSIAWRKAKDTQRWWFRRRTRDTAYHEMAPQADEAPTGEKRAVRQALASLTLDQRAAVMLCFAHGFTHAEVSEMLAMPLGTVKSHISRGRERLREVLGDEE